MKGNVKEVACVKCGATMRCGYLVEKEPFEIIPAGLGFYWISMRGGFDTLKTVALIAYACPECGFIEQYVRRIEKDREKILKAPKT
jgi:Zn ribbon nucleic-acid-binding protein